MIRLGFDRRRHPQARPRGGRARWTQGHRWRDIAVSTDRADYERLLEWSLRGASSRSGIEGTGSYGGGLPSLVRHRGYKVIEVVRPMSASYRFPRLVTAPGGQVLLRT